MKHDISYGFDTPCSIIDTDMCHKVTRRKRGFNEKKQSRNNGFKERINTKIRSFKQCYDMLDLDRKEVNFAKNRVSGGYYMMSRRAEKNLRVIQRENPSAGLAFSVN